MSSSHDEAVRDGIGGKGGASVEEWMYVYIYVGDHGDKVRARSGISSVVYVVKRVVVVVVVAVMEMR